MVIAYINRIWHPWITTHHDEDDDIEILVGWIHGQRTGSYVHVLETLVPLLLKLLEGFGERGEEAMLVLRERLDVRPKVKSKVK